MSATNNVLKTTWLRIQHLAEQYFGKWASFTCQEQLQSVNTNVVTSKCLVKRLGQGREVKFMWKDEEQDCVWFYTVVFSVPAPCSLLVVHQCIRGTCCLHIQDRNVKSHHHIHLKSYTRNLYVDETLLPQRWRQHVPWKCWILHSTTQKTTTKTHLMKTSNPTRKFNIGYDYRVSSSNCNSPSI